ncbi:MAG TPA: cell division protein FtsH, partial [Thermoleophilia bacterium]
TFGHDPAQPFLGRDYGMGQEYSDETARRIDAEIRRVIDEAYETASGILTEHRDELDKISALLMEKETIDREEFEALLSGMDPEEVFRLRDEAKARKVAESKRVQRQRRPREQEILEPDSRERVVAGGVTPMAPAGEE